MKQFGISSDEQLTRRFYGLTACVTLALLLIILLSITQFGAEAWEGRQSIGFLLPGGKEDAAWARAQYMGMQAAANELGYELVVKESAADTPARCREAVQDLAARGVRTIVFSYKGDAGTLKKLADEYPRLRFWTEGQMMEEATNMDGYVVSYQEADYLAGILAGLRTRTNRVGYLARSSAVEVNQSINAFALGAQSVNPEVQVLLAWTGDKQDREKEIQAVRTLKAERADILGYHLEDGHAAEAAEQAGMEFIAMYGDMGAYQHCIASMGVDWRAVYLDMLQSGQRQAGPERLSGIAELALSPDISLREKAYIETVRWQLQHGRLIFAGEIRDRGGFSRCSPGEAIGRMGMDRMNWQVRGVSVVGN